MKKLAIALLGLFVATAQAETKYTLVMSGVTWGGCKTDVRSALEKSFKAVDVTIEKGEDRKQSVKFASGDKTITRGELQKAINDGKHVLRKHMKYIVWKVRKEKAVEKSGVDRSALDRLEKELRKKNQWHLLLLRNTPFTQV